MGWRVVIPFLVIASRQYGISAQQTWPASTDELEDILFLTSGYRSRGFPTAVTPCSTGAGPGRIAAAEWIRVAFHDMATANTYQGTGGLDASIALELTGGENIGDAFTTTITTYAPFFSSQTSLADIIAAGVYTATRSCGGPIIPVRGGRIDATEGGPLGVPQPQNSAGTFQNQFDRMGFSNTEMIQFVACGHTLGSVHSKNFPSIVPVGTAANESAPMDTTETVFDNAPATEYVSGTSQNPLVIPVNPLKPKNSDFVVYTTDNNATIQTLTDPTTFTTACIATFQKMIETVPAGVVLTDVVKPYEVKPYALQLTLLPGGSQIAFTGDVRIRTTQRSVANVQLVYKDRTGKAVTTPISATLKGSASGFDDTFQFFSFDAKLSADTSISSFNLLITSTTGTTETQDNNGNGFKMDDSIIYQAPQSCLDASGKLTVVAAIRNSTAPNLNVVVKNPVASPSIVPTLSTATAAMATQSAVGSYQLYAATYTFADSQAQSALFGVSAGDASDNFKNTNGLPSACVPLSASPPNTTSSSVSSAAATSSKFSTKFSTSSSTKTSTKTSTASSVKSSTKISTATLTKSSTRSSTKTSTKTSIKTSTKLSTTVTTKTSTRASTGIPSSKSSGHLSLTLSIAS